MLVKTMDYLDHFARFKRKENVEAVERLLSAHQELAKFERAQLGTYYFPFHLYSPMCISISAEAYKLTQIRLTLLRTGRGS
jgi:hypothetical protein